MKRFLALLSVLMMLLSAAGAQEEETAPLLEVHQMAIGYADGYYIRCGDIEIVIDGGNPNPKWPTEDVVNYLRAVGATTLDACIITHWHKDHCDNVNVVLAEFGGENTVTYSPSEEVHPDYAPLANGTYMQMKADDVILLGDLTITCVGPSEIKYRGRENGDSLNFVLQYGTRRFLFTGDYGQSKDIVARAELCANVDVLKFPHHGSEPFEIKPAAMKVVNPSYVLIPSTFNNYKVFRYFTDQGVEVIRENVLTQREGHIVIVTDGGDLFEARTQQDPAAYAPDNQ